VKRPAGLNVVDRGEFVAKGFEELSMQVIRRQAVTLRNRRPLGPAAPSVVERRYSAPLRASRRLGIAIAVFEVCCPSQ